MRIIVLISILLVQLVSFTNAQSVDDFGIRSTRWFIKAAVGTPYSILGDANTLPDNRTFSFGLGYVLFHKESSFFLDVDFRNYRFESFYEQTSFAFRNSVSSLAVNFSVEPDVISILGRTKAKFRGYLARSRITPIFQFGLGLSQHSPEINLNDSWTTVRSGVHVNEEIEDFGFFVRPALGVNFKLSQRSDFRIMSSWHVNTNQNTLLRIGLENGSPNITNGGNSTDFWSMQFGFRFWLAKGTKRMSKLNNIDDYLIKKNFIQDFTFDFLGRDFHLVYNNQIKLNIRVLQKQPIRSGDIPLLVRYGYGYKDEAIVPTTYRHSYPIRNELTLNVQVPLQIPITKQEMLNSPRLEFSFAGKKSNDIWTEPLTIRTLSSLFSNQADLRVTQYLKEHDFSGLVSYVKKNFRREQDHAIAYLLNGDIDNAERVLKRKLLNDPRLAEVHYLLACIYSKKKQYDSALQYLEKSLVLDRRDRLAQIAKTDYDLSNVRNDRRVEFFARLTSEGTDKLETFKQLSREVIISEMDLSSQVAFLDLAFNQTNGLRFKYLLAERLYKAGRLRNAVEQLQYIFAQQNSDLSPDDFDIIQPAQVLYDLVDGQKKTLDSLNTEDLRVIKEAAGNYYSLFIIQRNYNYSENSTYDSLPNAYKEKSEDIIDLLRTKYGFLEENSKVLFDAKKSDILRAFSRFQSSNIPENSSLLIFYSGHGDAFPNSKPPRGYWCPVDIVKRLGEPPADNFLENRELTTLIRQLPMRHVLVVSDACYSGLLGMGALSGATKQELMDKATKQSRFAISSITGAGDASGIEFLDTFYDILLENENQVLKSEILFHKLALAVEKIPDYLQAPARNNIESAYPLGSDKLNPGDFLFIINNY